MDVLSLVAQMSDTISEIHSTVAAISSYSCTSETLSKLDLRCDAELASLDKKLRDETLTVHSERQRKRKELLERRRKEDEEISRLRQLEDEEILEMEMNEDNDRNNRYEAERERIEDIAESEMEAVESEATKRVAEGQAKLQELEKKRQVSIVFTTSVAQSLLCRQLTLHRRNSIALSINRSTCPFQKYQLIRGCGVLDGWPKEMQQAGMLPHFQSSGRRKPQIQSQ